MLPGEDVTTYTVTGLPPLSVGGVQLTVACPLATVMLVIVGALGGDDGVVGAEAVEGAEVPLDVVAVTVKV